MARHRTGRRAIARVRRDPALWTDRGDRSSAASPGTAVYHHDSRSREDDCPSGSLTLELGAVRDIARVVLNGADCGIVWTAPFEIDVSAAVRAGDNHLEVHVATPWRNRLIAEAAAPDRADLRADDPGVRGRRPHRCRPGCAAGALLLPSDAVPPTRISHPIGAHKRLLCRNDANGATVVVRPPSRSQLHRWRQ